MLNATVSITCSEHHTGYCILYRRPLAVLRCMKVLRVIDSTALLGVSGVHST